MTKKEIRIKVAELCGWQKHNGSNTPSQCACGNWSRPRLGSVACDFKREGELPNYPESLDACEEFEKILTPKEEELYVSILSELIMEGSYEQDPRYLNSNLSSSDSTYRATAEQRCRAYLKVKGVA